MNDPTNALKQERRIERKLGGMSSRLRKKDLVMLRRTLGGGIASGAGG